MLQWAVSYLTYQRSVRLITGGKGRHPPGQRRRELAVAPRQLAVDDDVVKPSESWCGSS